MFTFNKINLINWLFALLPLTIIIGNLAINLNIVLICIIGLIIFKKKIFFLENQAIQYLIYFFFFYLIIITGFNNIPKFELNDLYKEHFFKSIFFLRFLLLFLILNELIETKNFNIKLFFVSSAFFSLTLSLDILIQYNFGKDIFGYPLISYKASGFFKDELIAGGYLQKFLFFFFVLIILKNKYLHKNNLIIFFLFLSFIIPVILTGNRMPLLIYISSCVIFFLINKKIKEFFLLLTIFFIIIYGLTKYSYNNRSTFQINNFINEVIVLTKEAPKLFYTGYTDSKNITRSAGYVIHFNSGIQVWKKNKLFGLGLKSFLLNCTYGNKQVCNNHPHNYFIEILLYTGVIGIILIYSIFILAFFNIFKYVNKLDYRNKLITFPFFIVTFFEFFPLRSTGSFFTTNNSVIIFLFLAFFINLKKIMPFKKDYKI